MLGSTVSSRPSKCGPWLEEGEEGRKQCQFGHSGFSGRRDDGGLCMPCPSLVMFPQSSMPILYQKVYLGIQSLCSGQGPF